MCQSRTPVRAQFGNAGRVTKPFTKFNRPTLLENPPSEKKVFGSDRVFTLPPEVARRATIAWLVGWNESLIFVNWFQRGIVTVGTFYLGIYYSIWWAPENSACHAALGWQPRNSKWPRFVSGKKHTGRKRPIIAISLGIIIENFFV